MTWLAVARRDVREYRADRTLASFCAFFALACGAVAYVATGDAGAPPLSEALALMFLFGVPLTAASFVDESIPRAVVSGRVRLTLSLPHARGEYVAGVGAAGLAATLLATAVGVASALAIYLVRGGPVAPLRLAGVCAVVSLLAAAFTAATLAFTARSRSPTLSTATAYGFFLVSFVWPAFVQIGRLLLDGELGIAVSDAAANAVVHLSPVFAFQAALAGVETGFGGASGSVPPWAGVLVLLAWTGLGYALAARRFGSLEL
ncbi:ABC transporter permease subunit [Halobacterium litoreum]|uniref:ABC transporter permease subunit n=1 Tax=Halobacterium litoreum TaxID=2039234 RepID=A0ABD5NEV8_9EURY|nr:ABC transporter permease subunit [Halobacterium litoreum]UHH13268.1 ABC transporter permease [Halobacterium litoreum]